ncbi:hypothetical protein [Kitasatospora sp. NPDC098663]|uniref:hypothetical protein n=1 Tax=Kitasatospora sp. NPDC098663 TaxID=3364096 RepID=UPI0037FFE7BD
MAGYRRPWQFEAAILEHLLEVSKSPAPREDGDQAEVEDQAVVQPPVAVAASSVESAVSVASVAVVQRPVVVACGLVAADVVLDPRVRAVAGLRVG